MNKRANSNTVDRDGRDVRPGAIGAVWLAALAILGVSIPLVAVLKTSSFPILVVLAAVAVTGMIWNSGEKEEKPSAKEVEAMRETIRELEERLENVEVINRYSERMAEREAGRAREVHDEVDFLAVR